MPHLSYLPPEARLLLLATKPREPTDLSAIEALAQTPLNWRMITHLAEREKLISILWYGLRDSGIVPPGLANDLGRRAAVIEFRMAMLEASLVRVVAELAAIDIPVLLLKGAALATTVYPSFAHRPMGDLDILVAPDHAQRAWIRMREIGWVLEDDDESDFHTTYHHLQPLMDRARTGLVLEIHRAILPITGPFPLAGIDVWNDSRTRPIGAHTARVPADTHQLLHLCIHFAWSHALHEGMARTTRDVACLVATADIDWVEFVALAKRAKATTCAYWTLVLARDLSAARVPSDVLASLQPPACRLGARSLERSYVMSALFRTSPSIRVDRLLWTAGMRPRASGHGGVRPWDVNDEYVEKRHYVRASLATRLATHTREAGRWLRFAKLLLARD